MGRHETAHAEGQHRTAQERALKDCEFCVSRRPDRFAKRAAKATFGKIKKAQEVVCRPVRGRYVLLRALSEVNDGPWASVAELGVIGE